MLSQICVHLQPELNVTEYLREPGMNGVSASYHGQYLTALEEVIALANCGSRRGCLTGAGQ